MKVIVPALTSICGSVFLLVAYCLPLTAQKIDYAHWVNPFIGTGGHGHTFPGATMPFGMVQLSPDTRTDNWDGSSGYHYSDDVIYGFSHTHLSGTGIPDYCDLLLMPTVGEPQFFAKEGDKSVNGYASKFSHANEKAEPGYYSVRLDDDGIFAEMTATPRVGLHRYTFSGSSEANIQLDLRWRDRLLDTQMSVVGKNRVEGFRRSSSWAKDQIIYFVAEFSRDFDSFKSEPQKYTSEGERARPIRQNVAFRFRTTPGEKVLVKVALSPVSIEGARKNLAAELPGWDFDKVRSDARAAWNKELSKIEVSGGTDAQTTNFYTALYHTMIQPNIFNDVDGNYRGHDGKIHNIADDASTTPAAKQATPSNQGGEPLQKPARSKGTTQRTTPSAQSGGHPSFVRRGAGSRTPSVSPSRSPSDEYTIFSLWDTFRAAHPLYTIIEQKRTVDFINTFIRQYEQGGRLPVWELAGNETDTMIGYHAVSVIADAMAKGIKGFDYEKAYAAAKHSAELDTRGLAAYKKRGYISMEDENESVSKTLEYAYDDACIAGMAFQLASPLIGSDNAADKAKAKVYGADIKEFLRRSQSYENLFDPSRVFMRPKKNGGFVSPFAPNEVTFNYTEGNAWVYSFFVPQDVDTLMRLHGGKEAFAKKLDDLFTTSDALAGREQPDITGLIGQYAHGNEPSHHIAYLYNFTDEPWKTQQYVHKILSEFYKPTPDGLIGNEDCGQMSAWYVLSASGFYSWPPFAVYLLGTPVFKEIKYHLENGKTFIVRAPNASASNTYIRSVRLNGKRLEHPEITYPNIANGGVLDFDMSPVPVKDAFTIAGYYGKDAGLFTPVPIIGDGRRTFQKSMAVSIQDIAADAKIFYTLDGNEPTEASTLYAGPITIEKTTTVKAVAISAKGHKSQAAEATYNLVPHAWTVKIESNYNLQYTGGGDEGLIDGIRGTTCWASGEWQGYQGQDLVATIDLKKDTRISTLGGGFLQDAGSWIWMPTHIEFEVSPDGVNFERVADIKTDIAVDDMKTKMRDYTASIKLVEARYVRVHAYNLGKIPAWHPGAGSDAFIFVDEVIIK